MMGYIIILLLDDITVPGGRDPRQLRRVMLALRYHHVEFVGKIRRCWCQLRDDRPLKRAKKERREGSPVR